LPPAIETRAARGVSAAGGAQVAVRGRASRRATLVLFAGLAALFFAGLGRLPLVDPDEGRYAEIPREMLANGDWIVPRLDGVLYFEKPPLYYWLNAVVYRIAGLDETTSRVWSALFALGGAGLALALARSADRRATGLGAAAVLGSSPLYLTFARVNSIDMTLAVLVSATLTLFWLAHERPPGRATRALWYGAFVAAALAVLTKGLIGIVIPGAVVFLYVLLAGRWALLRRVPWWSGSALFLAVALPWHLAIGRRHPDFWWFYFVHEHFLRYSTGSAHRAAPFWFFFAVVLLGMLPWSGLVVASAKLVRLPRRERTPGAGAPLFLALWSGFVVVFFSVSKSKLVPYVLPALVPLAVAAELVWLRAVAEAGAIRRWVVRGGIVGVAGTALLAMTLAAAARGWIPRVPREGVASMTVVALALAAVVLAAVAARAWARWAPRSAFAASALCGVALFGCVLLAAQVVGPLPSTRQLARLLRPRLASGDRVVAFGDYPRSLSAYLGREIAVVGNHGELSFGIDHLDPDERARRFPEVDALRGEWQGEETVYLVAPRKSVEQLREAGIDPGLALGREGEMELFSNRRSRE